MTNNKVPIKKEREQLYIWISELFQKNKNKLSIEQLRVLHYILGYDWHPDFDGLLEYLEQAEVPAHYLILISDVINNNGFVVYRKPYL